MLLAVHLLLCIMYPTTYLVTQYRCIFPARTRIHLMYYFGIWPSPSSIVERPASLAKLEQNKTCAVPWVLRSDRSP